MESGLPASRERDRAEPGRYEESEPARCKTAADHGSASHAVGHLSEHEQQAERDSRVSSASRDAPMEGRPLTSVEISRRGSQVEAELVCDPLEHSRRGE